MVRIILLVLFSLDGGTYVWETVTTWNGRPPGDNEGPRLAAPRPGDETQRGKVLRAWMALPDDVFPSDMPISGRWDGSVLHYTGWLWDGRQWRSDGVWPIAAAVSPPSPVQAPLPGDRE